MHRFLPIGSMFEHRVENGQQFAHTGDQRHLAFVATRTQLLIRVPNDRVTAGGHQGRHVEGRAHGGAAPQHVRGPRTVPLSRLRGATPTSAAIWRRVKVPNSANSATRVRLRTGPTPGTLWSKSVCSCYTGLWRMRQVRSLSKVVTCWVNQVMWA